MPLAEGRSSSPEGEGEGGAEDASARVRVRVRVTYLRLLDVFLFGDVLMVL